MPTKPRRTPAEVAAEASIEHTGRGTINKIKGSVKKAVGTVTGDRTKKVSGTIDRIKGSAQQKLGRLEAKEARLESGATTKRAKPRKA